MPAPGAPQCQGSGLQVSWEVWVTAVFARACWTYRPGLGACRWIEKFQVFAVLASACWTQASERGPALGLRRLAVVDTGTMASCQRLVVPDSRAGGCRCIEKFWVFAVYASTRWTQKPGLGAAGGPDVLLAVLDASALSPALARAPRQGPACPNRRCTVSSWPLHTAHRIVS